MIGAGTGLVCLTPTGVRHKEVLTAAGFSQFMTKDASRNPGHHRTGVCRTTG